MAYDPSVPKLLKTATETGAGTAVTQSVTHDYQSRFGKLPTDCVVIPVALTSATEPWQVLGVTVSGTDVVVEGIPINSMFAILLWG